jgi:peptide/nickel transport system substrate-binding protein
MQRREFIAAGAATAGSTLVAPRIARSQGARVLRFVPQSDIVGLDPVWTPTYPTRDHSLLVFDQLYGQDAQFRVQPQMVEGHRIEDDGRRWELKLRAGLRFHDNTPVLARDCVASIRRWAARDPAGASLMERTAELTAADDRTIVFRLHRPFPLLAEVLGKLYPRLCVIMPERLANTDPAKQVTEMIGSGPFRFRADERVAGSRLVYERFAGYEPRTSGTTSGTAGPKVAHFDRVEWQIIPDASTAMSALQSGEIDWWLMPDPDLLAPMRRNRRLTLTQIDPTGQVGTLRFNHLTAPFNNPAIRRAFLRAVVQADFMTAVVGPDRTRWRDGLGFFMPGSPSASAAGMEMLANPPRDGAAARRELEAAGYKGEKVVLLLPTDIANLRALGAMCGDLMKRIGMNVDIQSMGWNTLVQRRFKQDPVDAGGWSVFCTFWNGLDQFSPAGHAFLRGNGQPTGPGWPTSEPIEKLRNQWLDAPDETAQKKLAEQLQVAAYQDVPYVPLGQMFHYSAHQANLTGMPGIVPAFWGIRRG